jgi:uncharacterized protein (DUF885 family)
MARISTILVALLGVCSYLAEGCGGAPREGSTQHATEANAATRALHATFDEEWERDMRELPVWASELGDMRGATRWDDVSLAAHARRDAHDREVLAKLGTIPRSDLSRDDALSYDLFRHKYEDAALAQPFRLYLMPINQRGGIQTADDVADALPFATKKHYEDWNERLRAFAGYMDQTIELLAEGARSGITQPKIVMQRVVNQIEKQIVTDETKSPFFAPYKKTGPSALSPADRDRLAGEAKRAIRSSVIPSFEKLRAFWSATYLPACKDEIGAWNVPNGSARYAYLVRSHTTTKLSPDEVHAIGLREVARIRGEMESAKAKAGFSGSLKEFFVLLRTDPRFFFKDGADLLSAYRDLSKRIDPLLVKVFRRLPRTPYGVSAIPEHVAPDTTTAYYREPAADGSRAGTYFVNLFKPEARPKWEMVALTLHESVPGHHLQIALAMEQENLPRFRRYTGYTAFVEGWALYAESLGEEMGVYEDPYAKMGQLTYEMWRAIRLVLDTGIHHLRWDRQRAIDFFMENAAKAELDVVNEVDRYIAWPGQALAYKIGELRIKELRKKRTKELGARFDLKAFHDIVLRSGPLPLDVLERQVSEAKE